MADLKTPADLKYTRSDEWVRLEGDMVTLGITDFAQDQLNDIVFVELPAVGTELAQGASVGVIESVKAASDLYTPIAGTVSEVNTALQDEPELINHDPYGRGWIVKLKVSDTAALEGLMDNVAYAAHTENR